MRRVQIVAAIVLSGCGPDRVDVQDWMLRDYSSVRAGVHQDGPASLRRIQFHDDFTMEYVEATQQDETTWIYDWEPTSRDSVDITPGEGADASDFGDATASPYSGPYRGEEVQDALRIERDNGVVVFWYPGAMCINVMVPIHCPIEFDAWCWEAYPCEEDR